MSPIVVVALLTAFAGVGAQAQSVAQAQPATQPGAQTGAQTDTQSNPASTPLTVRQAYAAALHQAIGGPGRVDLAGEATLRLEQNQLLVSTAPAARLLTVTNQVVPPDFIALLSGAAGTGAEGTGAEGPGAEGTGAEGDGTVGMIRFVPAGFVSADEALAWSPDDILASLNDTLVHANAAHPPATVEPREARRWVLPPRYNPETHQLSWAALVVPRSAPPGSDGAVTFHAIGFGRDGYIALSVLASVQSADVAERFVTSFLNGLNFVAGKAYNDVQPSDRRSAAGLAGATGLDSLHKATLTTDFWASDTTMPLVGSLVAAIGALGLAIYVYRHMRRMRRRV